MREGIHPKYVESVVSCACGYTFKTRSTKPTIKVEICSNCHPFFTGKQKLMDSAGRIDRFKKRFEKTDGKVAEKKEKVKKVAAKTTKSKILSISPKRINKTLPMPKVTDKKKEDVKKEK